MLLGVPCSFSYCVKNHHLFNTYLLRTHYGSGAGDTEVNKTDKAPCSCPRAVRQTLSKSTLKGRPCSFFPTGTPFLHRVTPRRPMAPSQVRAGWPWAEGWICNPPPSVLCPCRGQGSDVQSQRSPVEAVVPSQAGHPGPPEQLAGELPAAPGGDGCVGGDASAGSGVAAVGHTGGPGVRAGACGVRVCVSVYLCVRASRCAFVSVCESECGCGLEHTYPAVCPRSLTLLTVEKNSLMNRSVHSILGFFKFGNGLPL